MAEPTETLSLPAPSKRSSPTTLRPEAEMLLCCGRTHLDAETARRIRELQSGGFDWEYLLSMSQRHRMTPLLYWHLKNVSADEVPPKYLEQMRELFHANARRNLFLTGELLKLLSLFHSQGIEAVTLKGPVLAVAAYNNLSLREFCDLDIWVEEHAVSAAQKILASEGYASKPEVKPRFEASLLKFQSERTFVREDGRSVVDLHWKLSANQFSFPLDPGVSHESLCRTPLAGAQVLTLAPTPLILFLALHGAKHLWVRLEWVCSLAELLRSNPQLDWDEAFASARELNIERVFKLGVWLANNLLGVGLPPKVLAVIQDDKAVIALAEQIKAGAFQR